MLEPLLVLTFLNCFFMFSTTVTTCALWLQNKRNPCCISEKQPGRKPKIQKIKDEIMRSKSLQKLSAKLSEKKRQLLSKASHHKLRKKPQSETKSLGTMAQPELRDTQQQLAASRCEKLTSTGDIQQARKTPLSRKSTVVMEVSTTQKLIQLLDNDARPSKHSVPSDYASCRAPASSDRRIEFTVLNKTGD